MAQQLRALTALPKAPVHFPAPTWWLAATVITPVPGDFDDLFWPLGILHMWVHRYVEANTLTREIKSRKEKKSGHSKRKHTGTSTDLRLGLGSQCM